jgi:predicted O-methyltransferase YrrM
MLLRDFHDLELLPMQASLLRPNFPPRIQDTLERLYADALEVDPLAREQAGKLGLARETDPGFYDAMCEAYLPVLPDFGMLLYLIVRMTQARHVVEFGTSFGISTIHLAAALRDNNAGRVITTEYHPAKAEQARLNLASAGLDDRVEIRTGDALESLSRDLPERIDVLFLDGLKSRYLDLCRLLAPRLVSGSIIISDNSEMNGAEDYLAYVRDPKNGFVGCSVQTSALGYQLGHEILMKK